MAWAPWWHEGGQGEDGSFSNWSWFVFWTYLVLRYELPGTILFRPYKFTNQNDCNTGRNEIVYQEKYTLTELLQIGGTDGVLEDGREPANPVRELKPAVAE